MRLLIAIGVLITALYFNLGWWSVLIAVVVYLGAKEEDGPTQAERVWRQKVRLPELQHFITRGGLPSAACRDAVRQALQRTHEIQTARNPIKWAKCLQDEVKVIEAQLSQGEVLHAEAQRNVVAARTHLKSLMKAAVDELQRRGESVSADEVVAAAQRLQLQQAFELPAAVRPKAIAQQLNVGAQLAITAVRTASNTHYSPLGLAFAGVTLVTGWVLAERRKSKALRQLEETQGQFSLFTTEAEQCFGIIDAAVSEAQRLVSMFLETAQNLQSPANDETAMLRMHVSLGEALLRIKGIAR